MARVSSFLVVSIFFIFVSFSSGFEVWETSISTIRDGFRSQSVNCSSLIAAHEQRIQAYNYGSSPGLNSLITLISLSDLQQRIQELDNLAGTFNSFDELFSEYPLFCIPLIIKDNYNFAGYPTTAGSLSLATSIPSANCPAVQALIDAGGVVLAKANMAEFALDGLNTNSTMGGQTLNAYNTSFSPYGSSGGSAVAISASFGVVGMGTDTDGSIVNPSSAASLVGLRGTLGLVNNSGVVPLSLFQDVAGPICRSVEDTAIAFQVLTSSRFPQNFTQLLNPNGLRGAKIGFDIAMVANITTPTILRPDPEIVNMTAATLIRFGHLGAIVSQIEVFGPALGVLFEGSEAETVCGEEGFKYWMNQYLGALGPNAPEKTLADIIATNKCAPSVEGFLESCENTPGNFLTSGNCTINQLIRTKVREIVINMMDDAGIDVVAYPTANQGPPALAELKGSGGIPPVGWFSSCVLSAFTGLPSITFPMGILSNDLPIGFTFLARPYQESILLQYAYAYEQAYPSRQSPPSTPPLN